MNETLPKRAWTFVVHYRQELHRYLLRRVRRRQEIEDLTQEIYLRLLRVDEVDWIREPLAYLYTVAANVVADYSIAEDRHEHISADGDDLERWVNDYAASAPDRLSEHLGLQFELERALSQLPSRQAQALILHYQEGLYCEEIAQRLGMSASSVDKYLARGKARMRKLLWDR